MISKIILNLKYLLTLFEYRDKGENIFQSMKADKGKGQLTIR